MAQHEDHDPKMVVETGRENQERVQHLEWLQNEFQWIKASVETLTKCLKIFNLTQQNEEYIKEIKSPMEKVDDMILLLSQRVSLGIELVRDTNELKRLLYRNNDTIPLLTSTVNVSINRNHEPVITVKATSMLDILHVYEQPTRTQFLEYSRNVILDLNTAHLRLFFHEGNNRKVTNKKEDQPRRRHHDRFTDFHTVLSKEPLTERCYWEVEWKGEVKVAVTYKNISRSGEESIFKNGKKSWFHLLEGASGRHVPPSTVGVYLDYSAGLLFFYSVEGETMTLLHRVQTTFTEPLHAGVWLASKRTDSMCEFLHV